MREASERGSDLIVLSDAGMRDRTEFLLANVANRVSHAARCSVVFVADGSGPAPAEEPRERLLGRATEIGRVFARHGLRDDRPAADRARRLREALEELGPTFAKLGQVLSTRPDLLPPEYIAELARLQDDMPPLTQAEVVTVLETELGVPWEDALAHIDPAPLAAGTIAQVHRATLPDGSAVVLKVQRPSAERQILEDLALLELFAEKAGSRPAFGRIVDLPAVFAYLAESLRRELDFSVEAASIERIRPLLADFDRLGAPRVHAELSTRRLLVMEEIAGVSVSAAAPEEARREAARQLLSCYYQQVLGEGFFHADPHPGNLRWADGRVWFLDFGMVGELEPDVRLLLLLLVMAFWRDDAPFLAETLLMLSGPDAPAGLDLGALERDLQELLGYVRHGSLAEIELGQILTGMARIAARHGVRLPASLSLAGKALAQVQLTAAQLDPELAAGGADRALRGPQPHAGSRAAWRSARRALRAPEAARALAADVRRPRADHRSAPWPGAAGGGAGPRRSRALRASHDDRDRGRRAGGRDRAGRGAPARRDRLKLSAARAGAGCRYDPPGCARARARAGS